MAGQRVAKSLCEAVAAIGRERGWSVVRRITVEDNFHGHCVCDQLATRTMSITDDKAL